MHQRIRADRFGELLTVDQAWKFLNGDAPDKGSAIGRQKVRELMSQGVIRSVAMGSTRANKRGAQLLTRPQYLEEFLKEMFSSGNPWLDIVPIQHASN